MSKNKEYRRYRTRWLVPLRKYENRLYKQLYNIFLAETKYISKNYENDISVNGFEITRKLDLKKNIELSLTRMCQKVMPFAVQLTEKEIKKEFKQDDFAYMEYILNYLSSDFFLNSVENIATTYYDDILRIIQNGISKEQTREQIASRIGKEIPGISQYRSKTIAITETHRASSYASEKRAKDMASELGLVMLKDWIPVSDSRTRSSHAAMARVDPIPIDQMFVVGGEKMSRPNDPRGSAANTIRCRCILRYIPSE